MKFPKVLKFNSKHESSKYRNLQCTYCHQAIDVKETVGFEMVCDHHYHQDCLAHLASIKYDDVTKIFCIGCKSGSERRQLKKYGFDKKEFMGKMVERKELVFGLPQNLYLSIH